MITYTNRIVDGVNVEFKHYNDRAGTILFRVKHGKITGGWNDYANNDEWVAVVVKSSKDRSGTRRLF
jgi:hypothetical protein